MSRPNPSVFRSSEDENASACRERAEIRGEGRESEGSEHEPTLAGRDLSRIAFVAAAAGALWFVRAPTPFSTGVGVLCAVVGGYPIFRQAIENIFERRMTMELSMAIAILAALAIREVFTALVITLFVLAAFLHVASEMVFILNSARLVPRASLAGDLSLRPPSRAEPSA